MQEYLVISTSVDLMRVASEDIVFISSDGNYSSFVFTYGESRVVTIQLGQVERLLAEQLTHSGADNGRFGVPGSGNGEGQSQHCTDKPCLQHVQTSAD